VYVLTENPIQMPQAINSSLAASEQAGTLG